ncbi:MAG: MogA/MoaB family molybdenum cofactor biosynthesis protein [Thermovirgaceae bacterium]|nr:MogA/MoaB family molybdenum cofactor biosynthesis protein [Synergistales bacterium]HPC75106.1 MogA/MoaB family molybdenum cofactor biosynthesis protein [Synergistales bacterium]HRS48422.1 MogA/MoaB family molybdenum cofactor biosynthesis protein [Thermovirgaceae bacterium]HRU90348.1 MogA/MoaB family molybdenum cofactor biosynthesis protein [Thermovirgaceae bacterium]
MKNRVLGFSGRFSGRPMVYLHSDDAGNTLADGSAVELILEEAGKGSTLEGVLGIRVHEVPAIEPGDLLSFPDGLILRRKDLPDPRGAFLVFNKGFLPVSSTFVPWRPLKVGVLTVSDKGSRGERVDTAGPALESSLPALGAVLSKTGMVPDETVKISDKVREWMTTGVDIILVTGGTGISKRDVTPEAVKSLGCREIPGIGEYMRWKTSFENERSILSRSLAVACSGTIVITLPGSERGAVQCFSAVAPVLRHAVEVATGRSGDCAGPHR